MYKFGKFPQFKPHALQKISTTFLEITFEIVYRESHTYYYKNRIDLSFDNEFVQTNTLLGKYNS